MQTLSTSTSTRRGRISGRGWAYIGAILGGAVSVAANVAHSYVPPPDAPPGWEPQTGAVVGAVFWPVSLFVAIEILARIDWPAGARWTAVRYLGLLPVALVAAVVSYRHLSGLLTFYGEDPLTATIGPLAVDGLMVMATGALLATSSTRTSSDTVAVGPPSTAPSHPRLAAVEPLDTDTTPTRHASSHLDTDTTPCDDISTPEGVVAILDRLGVRPNAGGPSCRVALREHGLAVTERTLRDAVRMRRGRVEVA